MSSIKLTIPKSKKYLIDAIGKNGKKFFKKGDGLPSGILNKKYTGIGATTLEILADRPSIIVSPTRSLAKAKYAKTLEEETNIRCLYVGGDAEISNEDISFFNKVKSKNLKIFAVADSLPRVIDNIGDEVYSKYFLLVDEIDTFQLDTSFRSSLEYAVDYFHNFDGATAISATLIPFSDKQFSSENIDIYDVELEETEKSELKVISSKKPFEALYTVLAQLISTDEKILLAVNSIGLINRYIKNLIRQDIDTDCIGVLCGQGSAKKIYTGVRRHEINNKGELPKKINFMTSAYFAGLDITDKFHLLILNSEHKEHTILSLENVHQIIGRGRNGLYSSQLISFDILEKSYDLIEREEILQRIGKYSKVSDEIKEIYKDSFQDDKASLLQNIANATIKGKRGFLRSNHDNEIVPSFFTIDYYSHKYNKLQEGLEGLLAKLKDHYELEIIENEISVFEDLIELNSKDYVESFIDKFDDLRISFIKNAQKLHKINGDDLIMMGYADEIYLNQSDKRNLNSLVLMALLEHLHGLDVAKEQFKIINDNGIQQKKIIRIINLFKFSKSPSFKKFKEYFELKKLYTLTELVEIVNTAYQELNLGLYMNKNDLEVDSKVLEILQTLFEAKSSTPKIDGKRVRRHEFQSFNSSLLEQSFKHSPSYEMQKQFGADLETFILKVFSTKLMKEEKLN